jgi:hypothetical protein
MPGETTPEDRMTIERAETTADQTLPPKANA